MPQNPFHRPRRRSSNPQPPSTRTSLAPPPTSPTTQKPNTTSAPNHSHPLKPPPPLRKRLPKLLLNILYSSSYTILLLLLLALLAITPADHIYQTISNNRLGNVFAVGAVYIVTALIALFIYASRLYTNRTALAGIPRGHLPILRSEVGRKVRRLIESNWRRSALVAWEGRPRDLGAEKAAVSARRNRRGRETSALRQVRSTEKEKEKERHPVPSAADVHAGRRRTVIPMETVPDIDPQTPAWGHVQHPGWSSPSHPEMGSLYFGTVVAELVNLLEAKAVGFAPADPAFAFLGQGDRVGGRQHDGLSERNGADGGNGVSQAPQPPPDPEIVALLQRRKWMSMREYVGHLASMGMLFTADEGAQINDGGAQIDNDEAQMAAVEDFLRQYEYARYSVEALTESEFERLMYAFSGLLGMVGPPDFGSEAVGAAVGDGGFGSEGLGLEGQKDGKERRRSASLDRSGGMVADERGSRTPGRGSPLAQESSSASESSVVHRPASSAAPNLEEHTGRTSDDESEMEDWESTGSVVVHSQRDEDPG